MNNIYKEELKNNIQRISGLYNLDKYSNSFAFGDRNYWGWKTIDFVNGTLQGGVHALSIAYSLDVLENKEFYLKLIKDIIVSTKQF